MKRSILLKKLSNQSINLKGLGSQPKTSKIWTKYSLIFSHSKSQFMDGLLSLVKKRGNSLCESLEEEQPQKQNANIENEPKKDAKVNPFLMAKAKLLKQKQSLQTQDSSLIDRLHLGPSSEESIPIGDEKATTWKQMSQIEKKNQKMVLRSLSEQI